jgi:hypothetical protein
MSRRCTNNSKNEGIFQGAVKTLTTKTELTLTSIITQYPNTDRHSQQLCAKHMQHKIAFQKASAYTANAADVDRQFLETYTN